MPDEKQTPVAYDFAGKNIGEALRLGAAFLDDCETARLDARVLLKAALGAEEADLIARAGEKMSETHATRYAEYLGRRREREPVAYIIGVKEFWSLEFHVTSDVLIPRNDSECLIEAATKRRAPRGAYRILDLGTGSGGLLFALLKEFPESTGVGVDRSQAALAVAAENARRLGLSNRTTLLAGDWLAPVEGVFDIMIANPPYISDSERETLDRGVAVFEPGEALFGGADGLDCYRQILPKAPLFLADDGLLLMECGADQTEALIQLVYEAGLSGVETFTLFDLPGRPRGVGVERRKPQN